MDKSISEMNNESLLRYKESEVVDQVELFAAPDSCEQCKSAEGKKYLVRDALAHNPLPIRSCANKYGCRCTYLPIV